MISDVSGIGSQQTLPSVADLAYEAYESRHNYCDSNIYSAAVGVIAKYGIMDGKVHKEIVDGVKSLKRANDAAELQKKLDRELLEQLRNVSWIHRWEWMQEQKNSSYQETPQEEPQQSTSPHQEQLELL